MVNFFDNRSGREHQVRCYRLSGRPGFVPDWNDEDPEGRILYVLDLNLLAPVLISTFIDMP